MSPQEFTLQNGTVLTVDSRFSNFLSAYESTPEYEATKQSILKEGKCLTKIIVWKNGDKVIVIDGHHRLKFVTELRLAGHTIADPEIEYREFENEAAAKLYMMDRATGNGRPNWSELERVFRIENDTALIAHFKTQAKKRMKRGKKIDPSLEPNEGKKGRVLDHKAAAAGVSADKYRKLTIILGDKEATDYVRAGRMSVNEAASATDAQKKKVQEEENALGARQRLPNWKDKSAGINTISHADVVVGIPLPDNSVDLTFTSSPYAVSNAKVPYIVPFFNGNYSDYLGKLKAVMKECCRVTKPGRYIVMNIDNCGPSTQDRAAGRMRYNCYSDLCVIATELGLEYADDYIWYKQKAISNRCMMGSKNNPRGQRNFEYILAFRKPGETPRVAPDDITTKEMNHMTMGMWDIKTETGEWRKKHKAPFPVALAERVIKLWSRRGEVVLDPFMGIGSTAVAAVLNGRQYVGFDINKVYVDRANERVAAAFADAGVRAQQARKTKAKGQPMIEVLKRQKKWSNKYGRHAILESVRSSRARKGIRARRASAKKKPT